MAIPRNVLINAVTGIDTIPSTIAPKANITFLFFIYSPR